MIKIVCSVCEKESLIKPQKLKDKNYCSHACYWESKRTSILKNCFVCNKEIKVKPCFLQDKNFCSIKCRSVHFSGENHQNYKKVDPRPCQICGKQLNHKYLTRSRIRFCSIACSSIARSGELAPQWNGGPKKYPAIFMKIRAKILDRDNHVCTSCGVSAYGKKGLHVHHIDGDVKNNKLKNLKTLCAKCHSAEHRPKSMKVKEIFWPYSL